MERGLIYMTGEERRSKIVDTIKASEKPVSATTLAKALKVSRQIIVGDIALIRAEGLDIIATNKGYIINRKPSMATTVIKVKHKPEDMYDELCTIVDLGAKVLTEEIVNDLYGRIVVDINVLNREDARIFSEKCLDSSQKPISEITGGVHFHTVAADNDLILIRVSRALNEKGYLSK